METTLNQATVGQNALDQNTPDQNTLTQLMAERQLADGGHLAEEGQLANESESTEEGQWTNPTWKIIATLFAYPGSSEFPQLLAAAGDWVRELIGSDQDGASSRPLESWWSMSALIEQMKVCSQQALEGEYTRYFDFQSSTCLYLTAHELGDSRKRGLALVALRRMLGTAGFEEDGTELPDYLPLLFEFLAAKAPDFDTTDLEIRLARVVHVIVQALPENSVYRGVLSIASSLLPDASLPEGGFVFANREAADLDELPYPLQYND